MDSNKHISFNFLYLRRFVLIFVGTCLFLMWVLIDHKSIPFGEYNNFSEKCRHDNKITSQDHQIDWPNLLINSETIDFEGFNNETGADHLIVPNIVHFIRFNQPEFTFGEFICLQSAYRYQRPDKIFIHTNNVTEGFRGKYWSIIEKDPELRACIQILPLEIPTEIFGQKLNPQWVVFHGSDVARFRLLMKYGGIYLDTDSFVIRNLDKYRKFECAVEWKKDGNQWVNTNIIIAHKDCRFLRLWLDNYRDYRPNEWYYNAGARPVQDILEKRPELIHRVPVKLCGRNPLNFTSGRLYNDENFDWRQCDTFHLSYSHRARVDTHYSITGELDEKKIQNNTYPFSRMAAEIINNLPYKIV